MAGLVVVAVWGVGRWASEPTFVPLYRDLDPADAGAIEEKLAEAGIRNRLAGGGSEIHVPVGELARSRVVLARAGMGSVGRPGLELFDKPSWGMTDFTQKVTYQRALEGELARTIGGMHGIRRAQVHLALTTRSPIRSLDRAASASVVLTLQEGASLSQETVKGITFVVANSVERLSAENVAVMDDRGRVLSTPSGGETAAGAALWQVELQLSVERRLAGKILDLLEPVVGYGRVRAEVAADLRFDQVDRTIESFDPDNQVLQTERRSESEPAGGELAGTSQSVVHNTYQTTRKLEKSQNAIGEVNRLTASVLIDRAAVEGSDAAELDAGVIEGLVRDVIGFDATRGDRVSVQIIPFGAGAVSGEATGGEEPGSGLDLLGLLERIGRILIGFVAVGVLLALGLKLLRVVSLPSRSVPEIPSEAGRAGGPPSLLGPGVEGQTRWASLPARGQEGVEGSPPVEVVRTWLSES